MGTNPFDELGASLVEVRNVLALFGQQLVLLRTDLERQKGNDGFLVLATRIEELGRKLTDPPPEWEDLGHAAVKRGKSHRTLVAAAKDGRLRSRRITGRGGKDKWLLSTADLDQHFPAAARKKKADGHNPAGFPDPFGSCLAAPSNQTSVDLPGVAL